MKLHLDIMMMIEIGIWTRSDPTFYKSVADPSRFDTNPTRGSVQLDYGSGITGYGITDLGLRIRDYVSGILFFSGFQDAH
jgi:hypothetical protein